LTTKEKKNSEIVKRLLITSLPVTHVGRTVLIHTAFAFTFVNPARNMTNLSLVISRQGGFSGDRRGSQWLARTSIWPKSIAHVYP